MKTRLTSILMLAVLLAACRMGNPTQGEKIGTIIRVARSGILCSTWEATIVRGGMTSGSGGFAAQPYDFTITSEEMASRAVQYMEAQQEVKLRFQAEGIYAVCRSDSSGHFAIALDPLK